MRTWRKGWSMARIAGLEDDPENAETPAWACRDAGSGKRLFHGGPGVVEAIAAFRPDVVRTGNRHPHVGGVDLLRLVKDRGETMAIPAVFVTAADREDLFVVSCGQVKQSIEAAERLQRWESACAMGPTHS